MTRWNFVVGGAATFVAAHLVEAARWSAWFGGVYAPWFLNSARAVGFTMLCLFVVGLLAGSANRHDAVTRGINALAGASIAMAVTLMVIGPGTIFPIVIVAGTLILAVAIAAGAVVGSLLRIS